MAEPIKLISSLISELDGGEANTIMSAEWAALVQTVQDYDRPGEYTIKLKIAPEGSGRRSASIKVETSIKAPRAKAGGSVLFYAEGGNLSRTDPFQQTIPGTDKSRANTQQEIPE